MNILGIIILSAMVIGCSSAEQKVQQIADTTPRVQENTQPSAPEQSQRTNEEETLPNQQQSNGENNAVTQGIGAEELSAHNSASDCWVAFQGQVYDITKFLPMHPGGIGAISPNCGTSEQFNTAFTGKHGTSKIEGLKKQGLLMGEYAG